MIRKRLTKIHFESSHHASFRSSFVYSLLFNFKSIVEFIIRFPGDSLTSQYGAIERMRGAILAILSHGLKQVCCSLKLHDEIE